MKERWLAVRSSPLLNIAVLWLAWFIILIGFQAVAQARISPEFPDRVLNWTVHSTGPNYQKNDIYLNEPLLNNQVAWDSEYYLSIAIRGYDDPAVGTNQGAASSGTSEMDYYQDFSAPGSVAPESTAPLGIRPLSLNYAFMPFYPLLMRILSIPLALLGWNQIATASLAGVIVSALGTLGGMIALFYLAKDDLEEAGGMRAAFYLIIFPAGFYLAQVYTEGLFIGLAFGSLACLRRRKMFGALLLAVLATWTRAVGVALVIPMTLEWFRNRDWIPLDMDWEDIFHSGLPWKAIATTLICFTPVAAFLVWRLSYLGQAFSIVEDTYFGRGLLLMGPSVYGYMDGLRIGLTRNPQAAVYYILEWSAILFGFAASFVMIRKNPEIGWFSLAVVFLSVFSGSPQGMIRYIMGAPAVFLVLAQLGKHPVIDRVWTVASLLLMGLLAILFTHNMWVA